MVRTNQGGSVLGFIIIGVVLALLFIGGAYIIRQQVERSVTSGPIKAPEEQKPQPQPQPPQNDKQPDKTPDTTTPLPQTPPSPTPSTKNELPKTGPAETAGVLLALALLAGASASYVQSRRQLRSSL